MQTSQDALQSLDWQTFRLSYRLERPGRLPLVKSLAWRGILGHVLKDHAPSLYERLFECTLPEEHPYAGRFRKAPNPYVVYVPDMRTTEYEQGAWLDVHLTLIGQATETFSDLFPLLSDLKGRTLGAARVPLTLMEVQVLPGEPADCWPTAPVDAQCAWTLRLETPLRVKTPGQRPPSFEVFVHRLVERLYLLAHFHGGQALITDYAPWKALARQAGAQARLRRGQWRRYSNRAGEAMRLNGWLGRFELTDLPQALLPPLRMGEHLHLGKASTMGMGRFRLIPSDANPKEG